MLLSPFHAYITARHLEHLSDDSCFLPVFASSDIQVYPFQVAAAHFALHSPYQKGVILCDESGMGKSHEAMLIVTQKWLEGSAGPAGQSRILLAIPNADLLRQWADLMEHHYTLPYVVLASREDWEKNINDENPNAFLQDAVILTTYDFLADQQKAAGEISWDITVFEEATALSSVYQEGSKQARTLKAIADGSFKLLLTGTPIEKNIMDLYGLIYFIDETIFPDAGAYLKRYLRSPENYPELSAQVSSYCFRTLRSQANQYAKIPKRIPITLEYTPSEKERELYSLLNTYIHKDNKLAFPQMEAYDLALRLLGLLSSSTAAILQTIRGVIKRLEQLPGATEELAEFCQMENLAKTIHIDEKAKLLLQTIHQIFPVLKKLGAQKKVLIFTESVETQKMLFPLLNEKYKTAVYNGSTDYAAIQSFKADGEILISTDRGARGFNMEEASCVIHYDLLYNSLKMEQRIDRCQRLNQQNDVITFAFIDKHNFADVRKLELINKRLLVSNGVFGVSDTVIGGFTDHLDAALQGITATARTQTQVEIDHRQTLDAYETENKQLVQSAEDILFTTFTKELSDKVKITPQYVEEKAKEINGWLWALVKYFFEQYNHTHTDCVYEIDDVTRTVTATQYEKLPCLFYHWSGSGSRKYFSQKRYGMAADFKPRAGRITLTSILGRGILHGLECADSGTLTVKADIEPCTIALYRAEIKPSNTARTILTGVTESGKILTEAQCRDILSLPVVGFTESEHKSPQWLRTSSSYHDLDRYVHIDALVEQEEANRSKEQAQEIDRMKLRAKAEKAALGQLIRELKRQVKAATQELETATGDRMKRLSLERKLSKLQREVKQNRENQFFAEMQLDLKLEEQINEFLGKEKLSAYVVRQFVVEVE